VPATFPAANENPLHFTKGLAEAFLTIYQDAFARHQAGKFAEAVHLYQWILSYAPDLPDVQNNLGHALGSLGKPDAAIAAYQRAIEIKPDFPEALCNWGLALLELDNYDEAEAKYRQAIKFNPGFSGSYNNLGLLLKEKGRLQEARESFEKTIALIRNISRLTPIWRVSGALPQMTRA
jgi:tetratricopeptide (TPR) repeat protein